MTRRLNVTDDARRDFEDIAAYTYGESGSREVADAFIEALRVKCERLADLPGILGTERSLFGDGIRSFVFRGYLIFFRYRDDVTEIVHVLRGARDLIGYFGVNE